MRRKRDGGKPGLTLQEVGCAVDPGHDLPSVEMLGKAQVTSQHPSASSTCLFICIFIFMSHWTMHCWRCIKRYWKNWISVLPPWQLTEKDGRAQVTKAWQGLVLNHWTDVGNERRISSLAKMTLPFTLGIKWTLGSPNTSPKDALGQLKEERRWPVHLWLICFITHTLKLFPTLASWVSVRWDGSWP